MLHRIRVLGALIAGCFFASLAQAQYHDPRALEADPLTATEQLAPVLQGLGENTFRITTDNPQSQAFFDQGLRLTYGFNHSEALRAFKESARLDPNNAMAWWGQALVLGPNINLPMMPYVAEQAWTAIQRAQELSDGASQVERELIGALALRYSDDPEADRVELDNAYADAMRFLATEYAGVPDIATLTASAIMNLSPWDYWTNDGVPYPRTENVLQMLERALEKDPEHIGVLHYYIHITEAQAPERGEVAADALNGLTPGAGHLLHMPSHIYMRLGRYADSFAVNKAATEADSAYVAACQAQGLYPVGYYPHNMHFMVWSAQMQGRYRASLRAAREISNKVPGFLDNATDKQPTGAGSDAWLLFETFLSQPLYTMVRFGDWDAILLEPQPRKAARFMTGVWHYARGLAFVHTGDARKASRELKALRKILDDRDFEAYPASLNGAPTLLQIAAKVLAGEIAVAREDYSEGIALLADAVRIQDGLLYMEPPDWFMPSRHYLGAALLDAGRPREAETVYWADLKKNPNNGFALLGVVQAQNAQGKDSTGAQARLQSAWLEADYRLTSSRF